MRTKASSFLKVYKSDLSLTGDLALALWYSAIKDYSKRFSRDKNGFTRIPSSVFFDDFGFDRRKVWRYNDRLASLGLIAIDRVSRGKRTWVGIKILR